MEKIKNAVSGDGAEKAEEELESVASKAGLADAFDSSSNGEEISDSSEEE